MDCRLVCLLSILAVCSANSDGRPSGAQCLSDSECSPGKCCVYLPGKDGATSCMSVGRPQENCRPRDLVSEYTVSDRGDHGKQVKVRAHYAVCPCAVGLTCSHEGACVIDVPYGSESHPAQVPVKP